MSTSSLYNIIPVDSMTSFKRTCDYYQAMLQHAQIHLDKQCAAEAIRTLQTLPSFNHHSITSTVLELFQEHQCTLVAVCEESMSNDPSTYAPLLESLALVSISIAEDTCADIAIEKALVTLRGMRFRSIITAVIDILHDNESTEGIHFNSAYISAHKKVHQAVSLAQKSNNQEHIAQLIQIERIIARNKYTQSGISSDAHARITKNLVSLLHGDTNTPT